MSQKTEYEQAYPHVVFLTGKYCVATCRGSWYVSPSGMTIKLDAQFVILSRYTYPEKDIQILLHS